jgi:hypothetical protein
MKVISSNDYLYYCMVVQDLFMYHIISKESDNDDIIVALFRTC